MLEPALTAGVIDQKGSSLGRLRFSHALVRDTIYSALSALRRAMLHARVGTAIEERHGLDRSHLAELSWHFFHAAPVLGPERGLTYALGAAEAAQSALAFEGAEDELRRALTLVELLLAGRDRLQREIQVQNRLAILLTTIRGRRRHAFAASPRARRIEPVESIEASEAAIRRGEMAPVREGEGSQPCVWH